MDFEFLSRIVEELASLLPGARVERVYQGTEGGIYFLLHRERKNLVLLIGPDRTLPRLHLVTTKPSAADVPHSFILLLRKHLQSAKLDAVSLLNEDRIVEFRFSKQRNSCRLIFELIGSFANLMLLDADSKILGVYYPGALSEKSTRTLMPGFSYTLPAKSQNTRVKKSVVNLDAASPNKAAEEYFSKLKEQKEIASIKQELHSCIKKALTKVERRVEAVSKDLDSATQAEEYKKAGDLVLANLDRLKTGMEKVELRGYNGEIVPVRLDPKLSPSRNADRFFRKYKKAKAGQVIISARLKEAKEESAFLSNLRDRVETGTDANDLGDVQEKLVSAGYLKQKGKSKAKVAPVSSGYRTILFDGWEILVGKGAAGNDHLTTKLARPDDLWLHAEGMPGSHVVVRNPKSVDVPKEVLVRAASLAAFYSKGKNAGKVSVTYTRAGLVKKPKGAKPGLVTLTERKSIMVKPEG